MKCYFITVERVKRSQFNLIGRDYQTLKKVSIRVFGFKPYFYVPCKENEMDALSIDDEPLRKIEVGGPWDIKKERKKYSSHYEADIDYTWRFMIDRGIYRGFDIPDGKMSDDSVYFSSVKGW